MIFELSGKYGGVAIADDEDYLLIHPHSWFLSSPSKGHKSYVRTRIGKNPDIRLHRLIMGAKKGQMIDHINGNTLDNRKANLRFCTNQQNQYNSNGHLDKRKINGFIIPKGIKFDKTRPNHPWVGRISFNKKRLSTKGYSTIEEAIDAYNILIKRYYGKFAKVAQ